MKTLEQLENSLNEVFGKKAPELPKGGKDFIVQVAPYLTLVAGILSALAAYGIYKWAQAVTPLVDFANELNRTFGYDAGVSAERWTVGIWLSLIVLVVTAVVYIAAFAPLKDRKKSGWNLVFYALLLNVAYGVVVLFTDYGGFGSFLGSLIGSAIGAYLLFQVRGYYDGKAVASKASKK